MCCDRATFGPVRPPLQFLVLTFGLALDKSAIPEVRSQQEYGVGSGTEALAPSDAEKLKELLDRCRRKRTSCSVIQPGDMECSSAVDDDGTQNPLPAFMTGSVKRTQIEE
jgi:hypothetical protein